MKSILVLVSTLISIAAFADDLPGTCPTIRTATARIEVHQTHWTQVDGNWVYSDSPICDKTISLNVDEITAENHCGVFKDQSMTCNLFLNGRPSTLDVSPSLVIDRSQIDAKKRFSVVAFLITDGTKYTSKATSFVTSAVDLKDGELQINSDSPENAPLDDYSAHVVIEDPNAK